MTQFSDDDAVTIANLQRRIDYGWNTLHTFLESLTPAQRAELTDAAGWTVKDHTIHLSLWEGRLIGLLTRQKFPEAMSVPAEIWAQDDDAINAYLRAQHLDRSWEDVLDALHTSHATVLSEIALMSDADLLRPLSEYDLDSERSTPIINLIVGNTFGHYADHLRWMEKIANPDSE